jgi:hypothetical protein
MGDDDPRLENYAKGYRLLVECGYRPYDRRQGQPPGYVGSLLGETVEAEAKRYALNFRKMDDSMAWEAGCTHLPFAPAAVLVLEAFRLMNAGAGVPPELVPRLLRRAAEEYERVVEEDRRREG